MVGLLAVVGHSAFDPPLPGRAELAVALSSLLLIAVPACLARVFHGWLQRTQRRGLPRRRVIRKLARLQSWSVPLVAWAIMQFGGWSDFVGDYLSNSRLTEFAGLLGPLVAAEVGLRLAQAPAARRLRLLDLDVVTNIGPDALRMVVFTVLALMMPAALLDLASLYRPLEVFFLGTHLGACLGTGILLLAMAVGLPLGFRWLLNTSPHLPPHLADEIRSTAAALGFRGRAVLSMDTNHRIANALLVGPLPWPRYLVLTDALMSMLDVRALRGVIAHEVGHARKGHTGLLIVALGVLPIALLYGLMQAGVFEPEGYGFYCWLGGLIVVGAFVLRFVAHRFEHEADIFSAGALGAEPCIRALRALGDMLNIDATRASWRHPSEKNRIQWLRAWELGGVLRDRFERGGRRLRLGIGAAALGVLAVVGWGLAGAWPLDRVTLALYTGDFPGARAALLRVDREALPAWGGEVLDELGATTDAALQLAPDGGPWQQIEIELPARAWAAGLTALGQSGAEAALPFFGLALSGPSVEPVRQAVYLLCRAIEDGDDEGAAQLRGHLERLQIDDQLRAQLAGI